MRLLKGSLAGLVLAGILAITPTAAFAGGGHFGGGGGGGHFGGGGGGHLGGGGGHFGGGHFAGASHVGGGHFDRAGGHDFEFRDRDHFRHFGGFFGFGDPYWYGYPYSYDPYYGYYSDNYGDYYGGQTYSAEDLSSQTVVAVQKELTQLGYYHGQIDGVIGAETQKAIRWFQSVNKVPVTGQIDDPTLRALQIT
jgi:hypothetical protein